MADREVTTKYILQGDPSGMVAAADKAKNAVKDMADQGSRGTKQLTGDFDLLSLATSRFSGVLGGIGLAAVVSQLHAAGTASERFRNSFEASTGSVHKGAAEYAYARAEALRLGLDLQSTADSYMKLTAAAKGTGLEGEKSRQIFSAVAGASRTLGLSSDQANGALMAIQQMMSKGTVQAEELRGQLGERLPGAFQIAARSMGVSTAELGKMLEKGEVISDDFLPRFAAELQRTFPPGEKAMAGMTAETERMKTAWFELKQTVMDNGGGGMFASAARGMTWLADETERFYRTVVKLDNSRKTKAGPLTASDKALAAPDFSDHFGGMTNSLYSPANPYAGTLRMGPERTVDFGATLTRDNPMTAKEAASFGKASRHLAARAVASKDLTNEFRKLVQDQEKDFLRLGNEIEATADAESRAFGLMTMGGDLKTNRYDVTNPMSTRYLGGRSGYRLMGEQQYSIPQFDQSSGREKERLEAERHSEEMLRIEERFNQQMLASKMGMAEQSLALLQQTAGEGSGIAIAALVSQRALAVAQIMINTNAAASAALLPPPVGLGPIAGQGMAAEITAMGYLNAGLTGAIGIAQVAQEIGKREFGGPVQAGRPYIVGERRPELFVPRENGTILPSVPTGGSSIVINQSFTITGVGADLTQNMKTIAAQAKEAAKAEILSSMNRGGTFAKASGRV
jgi:tape measure domain-containing protein